MNLSTETDLQTQMNLFMKQTTHHRLVVAKGDHGGGGLDWEFGISRCRLLHGQSIRSYCTAQGAIVNLL